MTSSMPLSFGHAILYIQNDIVEWTLKFVEHPQRLIDAGGGDLVRVVDGRVLLCPRAVVGFWGVYLRRGTPPDPRRAHEALRGLGPRDGDTISYEVTRVRLYRFARTVGWTDNATIDRWIAQFDPSPKGGAQT